MTNTRPGVAAVVVSLLLGVACSSQDEPDLAPPIDTSTADDAEAGADDDTGDDDGEAPLAGETFHVAQAVDDTLVVRAAAQESSAEVTTLAAEDELSGKIICLVSQQVGQWVEVYLPTGPAGRTGWVARDDVALSRHRFRIEVSRSERTLTLYTGEVVALATPVALGPDAPEVGEQRFIKELVQPPAGAGTYGSYAYGLSGARNDLAEFTSGEGVVAVHGTADPAAVGDDAPAGAIGIEHDVLTRLVDDIGLPLGTPVDVVE